MVFEPPIRNSGLEAGVFLGRQRYKKYVPDQREGKGLKNHGSVLSRWLRPADFSRCDRAVRASFHGRAAADVQ